VAAGLTLGGFSFGTSPAAAAPMPADCPHHSGPAIDNAAEHGKSGHDHGSKSGDSKVGGCHCPLMTCSGWTLAPLAFDLVRFDPAALPHLAMAADRFVPHPPGVPLQPPRA
jgi:hypothetical protein